MKLSQQLPFFWPIVVGWSIVGIVLIVVALTVSLVLAILITILLLVALFIFDYLNAVRRRSR